MKITKLFLYNYRNYEDVNVEFDLGINVIYGLNGQGKTNLVEAINYLSTLKSFRNHEDSELIKTPADGFLIEADSVIKTIDKKIKVTFYNNLRKIFLNETEIKRNSEFYGQLNVLVFSPLDVSIFIDIPQRRRNFIDRELAKISPSYFYSINKYKNILKQRNQLLKDHGDMRYLEVLTLQLAELADFIVLKRQEFIKELEQNAKPIFKHLYDDEKINLEITYQTYKGENTSSLQQFNECLQEDILRGKTTIGPHYDDLLVFINKNDIAKYGSQGQQRLAILSLKLGLLNVFNKANEEQSIVVLDDVMSELDSPKRKKLLSYFNENYQVFITTANVADIKNYSEQKISYYEVENGKIRRICYE